MMAPRRDRDLGYLGTMGLSRRQGVELTLIEHVPPAVIASLVGGALGVAMGWLLGPMIDIQPFVGPGLTAKIAGDPWVVTVMTVALAGIVVTMILLLSRFRPTTAMAVSSGDE
jgi:ABC-type lipoprotein release transport system permease subunit